MHLNDLNDETRNAYEMAQQVMQARRHTDLDVAHLLLALLRQPEGRALHVLNHLNVNVANLMRRVEDDLTAGTHPSAAGRPVAPMRFAMTPALQRVLPMAQHEATQLSDASIGSEHLLLALAAEPDSAGAHLLRDVGVTHARILSVLKAAGDR